MIQDVIALVIVAAAAVILGRRVWTRMRGKGGCGTEGGACSSCKACSTEHLTKTLAPYKQHS